MPQRSFKRTKMFVLLKKGTQSSHLCSDPTKDMPTWWLIPLSKWVITPVINGISRVNPLITGVITYLLSGMSHQVVIISSMWGPPVMFVGLNSPQ